MTRVGTGFALAIAGLAACGFHTGTGIVDDAPVTPASDAAIDSASDARMADAGRDATPAIDAGPGIDAAPTDQDGDGVIDSADNCVAISNADQHDEDGDRVGDVCDPCPQIANAITDTDGDGVADACDPHPTTAGDVLVRFEPLTGTGNLPTGWQHRGGGAAADWVRGNDVMTVTADNATQLVIFDAGAARHAIDVGLQVTSTGNSGNGQQFVTGLADVRSDIQQYFGCGLRLDTQNDGPFRELFQLDNPDFTALNLDKTDRPTAPGPYRIQLTIANGSEACVIPKDSTPHRQANTKSTKGNTFVGLRVNNVTVQFKYVAVYKF